MSGTRARFEKPARRAVIRPANESAHMITAAPLRAAKNPKVNSGQRAKRKREGVEPQPPSIHDGQG